MKKFLFITGCLLISAATVLFCTNIHPDGKPINQVLKSAFNETIEDLIVAYDFAEISVKKGASDAADCVSGWFLDLSYSMRQVAHNLAN